MARHQTEDPRLLAALCRYDVVARYRAHNPQRGQKRKLLEELAQEAWVGPDGEPFAVQPETIRVWVRRYRDGGLEGLKDKARPSRGVRALTEEQQDLVAALKTEVPERSLERIIKVAEELGKVEPGVLRRSTVHRVLQSRGISARAARVPDTHDLDRFEADFPNDLWQSDMLHGPWLPDPQRSGKVRRAKLYAFLDDHSRMLLDGRFSFSENLPHLELVMRRALQKHGVPRRLYYDNGLVYRSTHMRRIVAEMDIFRIRPDRSPITHTKPHRPMGHGKIEAFNRLVRSSFLAELKASTVSTLDELNEAFAAWARYEYNTKVHSEIGETPLVRWRRGVEQVRYAEEEKLRQAFFWKEDRTPDKTGIFSLLGIKYQTGAKLARRKVQVRFDPEALHEVEVWQGGQFCERVKPHQVGTHRRAKQPAATERAATDEKRAPTANYLGHLVEKRREEVGTTQEPSPRQLAEDSRDRLTRNAADISQLFIELLDDGVVNTADVNEFVLRKGPFDVELVRDVVERLLERDGAGDLHVSVYLDAVELAANENGGER
jgi:putative transposase